MFRGIDFFSDTIASETDPAWAIANDGLQVKMVRLEFHEGRRVEKRIGETVTNVVQIDRFQLKTALYVVKL